MAEPAVRGMTIDEFVRWEDGTDSRYELIDGYVVAMAPGSPWHGRLSIALGSEIRSALGGRPGCGVYGEAGIVRSDRDDYYFVADLAVTCDPPRRGDQIIRNPFLIVEILSPSTGSFDRQTKVANYREIPSVKEIVLLDSETVFAEVQRRDGDRWITEFVQGDRATLILDSIPVQVPMALLYEGFPPPEPKSAPTRIR